MPDCHNCPYNGQKNRRCLTCRGPSEKPHKHGLKIVSMETMPPREVENIRSREGAAVERIDKLTVFMHRWLHLPSKTRDLLALLITDRSCSGVTLAEQMGVRRQVMHGRLLRVFKKYPDLKPILYMRIKKIKR